MMEFVAGLAAGAVAGGMALAMCLNAQWDKIFRQLYCTGLIGQFDVVRRIEAGETDELVQEIADSIPSCVATVDRELAADTSTADALYAATRFYEATHRPVPEEIGPILSRVPARKLVCYRRQSLCSSNPRCLKLPTSLFPVSNVVQRQGWEKGGTLCGVRKRFFFFPRACGVPLTIGSCIT